MIPLLPLQARAAARPKPAAPPPAELAYVQSILRLAYTGRDGKILPAYEKIGPLVVDSPTFFHPGLRAYNFDFAQVNVYLATGRLAFLSSGLPLSEEIPSEVPDGAGGLRVVPRALTDAEAADRVARLYAASGWPGNVRIEKTTDLMGGNGACVEVRYVPTWGGVPYKSFQELVDLDRQTGRLELFSLPHWLPAPPASLVPGGTADQARLAALRVASAWWGSPLAENPYNPLALALVFSHPEEAQVGTVVTRGARPAVASLGPEHVAAFRAGQAILVYEGGLLDASGVPINVTLDARTGRVLWMSDPRPIDGGCGLAPRSTATPIAVSTAPRSWRVDTGKEGWNVWSPPADATLTPAPEAAPTSGKLTLTDGAAAFPATYDPATGLVGIAGKAYRPGPALADLLRRRGKG